MFLDRLFSAQARRLRSSSPRSKRRRTRRRIGLQKLENRQLLAAVVSGDFNGDGYDDMAVAAPMEDLNSIRDAGVVQVIYGGPTKGLHNVGDQVWHQNSEGIKGKAEAGDRFGSDLAAGDFNGDGIDDLAIGVAMEDWGNIKDAGAINVLYGSRSKGLQSFGDQVFSQNTDGVKGKSEEGDMFGAILSAGDFNGDGRDDLAIGVPFEDWGSIKDAGAINVLYGSQKKGLQTFGDQVWSQATKGIKNKAEQGDLFAAALQSGDFNGDGRDDLAIGVPYEDWGNIKDVGIVNVIYGSKVNGLHALGDQVWHQGSNGINDKDRIEAGDMFGFALAAGDFNANGQDDLAIGVPGEDIEPKAANNATSTATGFNGVWRYPKDSPYRGDVTIKLTSSGSSVSGTLRNGSETHSIVGTIDKAGHANIKVDGDWGDGYVQIKGTEPNVSLTLGYNYEGGPAFGVHFFSLRRVEQAQPKTIHDAGVVHVLYGSAQKGVQSFGDQLWYQDSEGINDKEKAEAYDHFAASLMAADFNGDGRADLAIGVPGESVVDKPDVGVSDGGPESTGLTGTINADFGLGDSPQSGAGVVQTLYGSGNEGVQSFGDRIWYQGYHNAIGKPEKGDGLGTTVSAGDFNGDGRADLVATIPFEDFGKVTDAGAVEVFYHSVNGNQEKYTTQFWTQDSQGIKGVAENNDRFGGRLF